MEELKSGKSLIKSVLIIICMILIFLLVFNNYDYYTKSIGKITSVENVRNEQNITVNIKNGEHKGEIVSVTNTYEEHLVYDEQYRKGDIVFLTNDLSKISGIKRDHWVAAAVLMLFASLLIFGKKTGLLTVCGIIANVALFALMIKGYLAGINLLLMTCAVSVLFTLVILVSISGFSLRTWLSFLSIIATMFIVSAIAAVLILTHDVGYDFLDFLPEPYTTFQADCFFMSQIIICCLGAVIDVAVTITSVSSELIEKTPGIDIKMLMSSAKEIADDISGTMINILLLTNVAAMIPVFAVSMSNDIGFMTVLQFDAFFDIVRFLLGAIGILLSVPISVFVSSLFLKNRRAS